MYLLEPKKPTAILYIKYPDRSEIRLEIHNHEDIELGRVLFNAIEGKMGLEEK